MIDITTRKGIFAMAKDATIGTKEVSDSKRAQNYHIRNILSKAFDNSGLNKNQLLEAINKDSGFEIAYNTLSLAVSHPSTDGPDLNTTINYKFPNLRYYRKF